MGWILWSGASAALKRAPLERLLLRVRPEDVMDPVAVVPALTPVGELVGIGRRVVALDERGMPTLLLPEPSRDLARHRDPAADHPAGLASSSSCPTGASSSSHRAPTPSRCCVRWPRTGWGVVVVTSAGKVRGLVTSERLNAVAEAVLGRN